MNETVAAILFLPLLLKDESPLSEDPAKRAFKKTSSPFHLIWHFKSFT